MVTSDGMPVHFCFVIETTPEVVVLSSAGSCTFLFDVNVLFRTLSSYICSASFLLWSYIKYLIVTGIKRTSFIYCNTVAYCAICLIHSCFVFAETW